MTATLEELYEAGFVYWQDRDTVNRGKQEKSEKQEKQEKQEQKTKLISFPDNDETDLKSKIFFSSDIENKRKLKSIQDFRITAQHFDKGKKESSQTGYIVESKNRFYETEKKKSKRKKLRCN